VATSPVHARKKKARCGFISGVEKETWLRASSVIQHFDLHLQPPPKGKLLLRRRERRGEREERERERERLANKERKRERESLWRSTG